MKQYIYKVDAQKAEIEIQNIREEMESASIEVTAVKPLSFIAIQHYSTTKVSIENGYLCLDRMMNRSEVIQ